MQSLCCTGGNGSLQSSREDLCEAGLDDGGVELRSVRTGLGEEVFPSQLYSQVSKAGGKTLAGAKVRRKLVRFTWYNNSGSQNLTKLSQAILLIV